MGDGSFLAPFFRFSNKDKDFELCMFFFPSGALEWMDHGLRSHGRL